MKRLNQTTQTALTALLCCCTLAGTNAYAGQAKITKTMPKAFQGNWSSSLKMCGRSNDNFKLKITPKKLTFWETSSKVINVVTLNNMAVVTASYSSEGETGIDASRLELRNGNKKLVDILSDGTEVVRYRCKK